jgi:hypothetical protein
MDYGVCLHVEMVGLAPKLGDKRTLFLVGVSSEGSIPGRREDEAISECLQTKEMVEDNLRVRDFVCCFSVRVREK